jgi:hypothetical protein
VEAQLPLWARRIQEGEIICICERGKSDSAAINHNFTMHPTIWMTKGAAHEAFPSCFAEPARIHASVAKLRPSFSSRSIDGKSTASVNRNAYHRQGTSGMWGWCCGVERAPRILLHTAQHTSNVQSPTERLHGCYQHAARLCFGSCCATDRGNGSQYRVPGRWIMSLKSLGDLAHGLSPWFGPEKSHRLLK